MNQIILQKARNPACPANMKKTDWTVEGMTCSNCALSITKYLQKEGMEEVSVNPIDGKVSFINPSQKELQQIESGISQLGYTVVHEATTTTPKKKLLQNNKQRFLFTLPFTALLMLHMFHHWFDLHWLSLPWVQLSLCLPVFALGMRYFGKSAWMSLRSGIPNMNVLVALGSSISFLYSLAGMFWLQNHTYLFFETTASIITLVFLGNYLEEAAMQSTRKSLNKLAQSQRVMANMIAFDDQHQEQIFPLENTQLKTGDLILIRTGETVPIDCKILWGDGSVNEAIITGESLPITKTKKDFLLGGSILESGTVKAQVAATGKDTVLSGILRMAQEAQNEKPPMQKLADRISAVFVPAVLIISLLTYGVNHFGFGVDGVESMMRAIAVLVISCPCAMGLATPAAISVGMGRAAKHGIIFRNAAALESFKNIRQIVFDKTGTLTTGRFVVQQYHTDISDQQFKSIVFSLEKYSNHPIAKSIVLEWKDSKVVRWKKAEEIKGMGVRGEDEEGNVYEVRAKIQNSTSENESVHNIHVYKNGASLGWIDIKDEIRPEAADVVRWMNQQQIKTILLTGDHKDKAILVAKELGIHEVFASHTPEMKLKKIEALNLISPTAMVGDGINDAPALAKATLGISLSEASALAAQQADVILMNKGLRYLPMGLGLGKHTYLTIRQNLFWAFAYNIVAIPVAALGFLTPTFSALAMGFSDVMLAVISLQLYIKKVY